MSFTAYWKEIAVVLAAIFAVAGAFFDIRDRRTKKITSWGRIFFVLTLLSMIGGIYAEWASSASEEKRNRQSQADMLKLLKGADASIREISRSLQPIERPNVTLFVVPDCAISRYKLFCDRVKAEGEREANIRKSSGPFVDVQSVDWSAWPGHVFFVSPSIAFFHDTRDANNFLGQGCPVCFDLADMTLDFNGGSQELA